MPEQERVDLEVGDVADPIEDLFVPPTGERPRLVEPAGEPPRQLALYRDADGLLVLRPSPIDVVAPDRIAAGAVRTGRTSILVAPCSWTVSCRKPPDSTEMCAPEYARNRAER